MKCVVKIDNQYLVSERMAAYPEYTKILNDARVFTDAKIAEDWVNYIEDEYKVTAKLVKVGLVEIG